MPNPSGRVLSSSRTNSRRIVRCDGAQPRWVRMIPSNPPPRRGHRPQPALGGTGRHQAPVAAARRGRQPARAGHRRRRGRRVRDGYPERGRGEPDRRSAYTSGWASRWRFVPSPTTSRFLLPTDTCTARRSGLALLRGYISPMSPLSGGEMPFAVDEGVIEHSRRAVRIHRSTNAFDRGARVRHPLPRRVRA